MLVGLAGTTESSTPHVRLVHHVQNDVASVGNARVTERGGEQGVAIRECTRGADVRQLRPAQDVVRKVGHAPPFKFERFRHFRNPVYLLQIRHCRVDVSNEKVEAFGVDDVPSLALIPASCVLRGEHVVIVEVAHRIIGARVGRRHGDGSGIVGSGEAPIPDGEAGRMGLGRRQVKISPVDVNFELLGVAPVQRSVVFILLAVAVQAPSVVEIVLDQVRTERRRDRGEDGC
mmetsp:Transcript_20622/g.38462  ORF Transcript_20622/g.38462 Transcript_20622/m.38462 type:complete len:231 (-) Transcript_20622:336-1028(-)